jgi:hypothetical protein
VLKDQRRPRTRPIRIGVQVLDHERPQILGVAGRDVQDEVVGAGRKYTSITCGLRRICWMKLRILPRALDCRLTEIIACNGNPIAAGSTDPFQGVSPRCCRSR